jgi:hypothetical protein
MEAVFPAVRKNRGPVLVQMTIASCIFVYKKIKPLAG